jgi:hypothetical protein
VLACAGEQDARRARCFDDWRLQIQGDKAQMRAPPLALLLTPAVWSPAAADQRSTAPMRCAVAALAAEQFRLKQGRWPKELQDLVAAGLLPAVPLDPHDGEPLRLRHAPDGLVVYSLAWRRDYDGKDWDDLSLTPLNRAWLGTGVYSEFRLWNPDRRNQPFIPERVPEEK